MALSPIDAFSSLPTRLLLDTCILDKLYEQGAYVWEGELPEGVDEDEVDPELVALRAIFLVNERAGFGFVVSPLTFAELANVQDFSGREGRVRWALDVLDHWLIMLDETGDRASQGGTVRHRFKLTPEMQMLESRLMAISDFRRDPIDRLLLVQYRMANCDAFLTTDEDTIWRYREFLASLGIRVLRPSQFWELLEPWAALWR